MNIPTNNDTMFVIKRDGSKQEISFDKITARIKKLCYGFNSKDISPIKIAQKVIAGIYNGVTTTELDCLAAETTAYSSTTHPDFSELASRIAISNLHKNTEKCFSKNIEKFYNYIHPQTKKHYPLISKEIYDIVIKHRTKLDSLIIHDRDFYFDYFGFKTLEKSYLIKMDGIVAERPQHMHLRVALGIHHDNIEKVVETYNLISQKYFTHATPTLYNAGTCRPQLSSCFLLTLEEDSIKGIYNTLEKCALISKYAGGIGLSIHNVRAKGSYISGTNGISNGIVPMLKVFNDTARYVDQCFVDNTPVYTSNGIKNIQDITVKDDILTHDGTYNRVSCVRQYEYDGEVVTIKCNNFRPETNVTLMHPVLVLNRKNKLNKDYVEAKDLVVGDYLAFPIMNDDTDNLLYNELDCYMYGVLLASGDFIDNLIYVDKLNMNDELLDYCKNYNVFYKMYKSENDTKKYVINNLKLYNIHLHLMKLSKLKLQSFVRGLMSGRTNSCEYFNQLRETTVSLKTTTNLDLIQYVFQKLGVYSITDKNQLIIPHSSEFKSILPNEVHMLNMDIPCITLNNTLYVEISEVTRAKYKGNVTDFDMAVNHNYQTSSGIVHNGGGKRKGSFAIYLEPWHADIMEFLDLKKQTGSENMRATDLFYAVWIPNLFMERVEKNENWSLFCPNEAPGLSDCHGEEFNKLYLKYEQTENLARKSLKARDIWSKILESQIETGTPYILYKDHCNEKSNQKNLGTIHSSNLCTEIVEYTAPDEIAVCNLASINLQSFVTIDNTFDFNKLHEITKVVTNNLNTIIDVNYYPVKEAENSNKRHRPIGIGVQGLADTFIRLRYPFESVEAKQLNRDIFETIYHAAMETSIELAKDHGVYSTYENSPLSKGQLQFDLWNEKPSDRWNWDILRENLSKYGARNSLLVAPMPTASTAQILGNNESIEPYTSNLYTRKVLAGEFTIINKHLLTDLISRNLWNADIRNQIMANEGSIQNINEIPDDLKELYKTVWEIKQKVVIDMAADRGAFICQSQSMNIHLESPSIRQLTSCHFYSWKKGLKTGCYYLRGRPKTNAIQFTVDKSKLKKEEAPKLEVCMPGCDSCGA